MNKSFHIIGVIILISEVMIFPLSAQEGEAWVLVEAETGRVVASARPDALVERRPIGSLHKVTIARAIDPERVRQPLIFACRPSRVDQPASQTCWHRPGHGSLNLAEALGLSCNAWFSGLLSEFSPAEIARLEGLLAVRLSERPLDYSDVVATAGRSPLEYCGDMLALWNGGVRYKLEPDTGTFRSIPLGAGRVDATRRDRILEGMALAISEGTCSALRDLADYAKTGTTYAYTCQNGTLVENRSSTDGFCFAVFEHENRVYCLLVMIPGLQGNQVATWLADRWQQIIEQVAS